MAKQRSLMLRLATGVLVAAGLLLAQDASIQVDASRKGPHKIPRTIYGTFLEPIGNSIYGGLWAQVLENPSFEDNLWSLGHLETKLKANLGLRRASELGLPVPWEPLHPDQGARYEPLWKDAANSSRSIMLMALPDAETGIRQEVFLPVHRITRFTGSLWAKHAGGPPSVSVSLRRRGQPAQVLAKAELRLTGTAWSRYTYSLALPAGALQPLEPADFVIAANGGTRILLDQVFLFPADNVDGMDPEMVVLSREMRTPLLRFGGNYTSAYHWRDGIGPVDGRVSMLNLAWGMPEYNHFGTDELLRFCRLIGAEPQIALNLGTGTPQEAAGWVRYVNEKWNGGKGGLTWELGNELWGDFQTGYPTEGRIASLTKTFSDAVRKVDPRARLIATGQDPDHFKSWNAQQLRNPPSTFQFLSTHFVVGMHEVLRQEPSKDFLAYSGFALPVELERRLRAIKEQINGTAAWQDKARIAFTEWLFWGNETRGVPYFDNMGGAICTGGMLNALLRTSDIVPISDMTGLIEFGGIWKKRGRVYAVPAYWVFRMYARADATTPVAVHTETDTYDVHEGNRRLPGIASVPYLDVFAATNDRGDALTLFCVNRRLDRDLRTHIRLNGFSARARAHVATVHSGSIYDANSEESPDAIRPTESELAVHGSEAEFTFPRASVTVVEFKR